MKISKILIEDKVKEKILFKHGIHAFEIKNILFNSSYILKTREKRYIATGYYQRYITLVFEIIKDTAFIITAYPSSEAQRKLYKHKRHMK